jgi:hypothetical protein
MQWPARWFLQISSESSPGAFELLVELAVLSPYPNDGAIVLAAVVTEHAAAAVAYPPDRCMSRWKNA